MIRLTGLAGLTLTKTSLIVVAFVVAGCGGDDGVVFYCVKSKQICVEEHGQTEEDAHKLMQYCSGQAGLGECPGSSESLGACRVDSVGKGGQPTYSLKKYFSLSASEIDRSRRLCQDRDNWLD